MEQLVTVRGRPLRLYISRAAAARLEQRNTPLLLEMELYFSCLIRKRVHVREFAAGLGVIKLGEKLHVWLRPVVTRQCSIRECEPGQPPVMDMRVISPERYFPHWLRLDYRHGAWQAGFGYAGVPG
jgi:hypothetical protein